MDKVGLDWMKPYREMLNVAKDMGKIVNSVDWIRENIELACLSRLETGRIQKVACIVLEGAEKEILLRECCESAGILMKMMEKARNDAIVQENTRKLLLWA